MTELPSASSDPPDTPFSRRVVGWLVGIAVLSFGVALWMGAFGAELTEPKTAAPSAFSWSAVGHRAAVRLLRGGSESVVVRRDPRASPGGPEAVIVLAEPDLEEMARTKVSLAALYVSARARGASVLLVLPKWSGATDTSKTPPWLRSATWRSLQEIGMVLQATDFAGLSIVRPGGAARCQSPEGEVEILQPQLLESGRLGGLEPLVSCGEGVLAAADRELRVTVLADPDLFNNHGLGRPGRAALARWLLAGEPGAKTVIFDEAIHGFMLHRNLLSELMHFPLLLATFHGVLVLGLLLWAGMGRFGKAQPPPQFVKAGKQALIESTARLLSLGGHTAESLARYFRDAIGAVASHHGVAPELAETEKLRRMQQLTDGKGLAFQIGKTWSQIRALGEIGRSGERAVRVARAIYAWRRAMTDAR